MVGWGGYQQELDTAWKHAHTRAAAAERSSKRAFCLSLTTVRASPGRRRHWLASGRGSLGGSGSSRSRSSREVFTSTGINRLNESSDPC